MEAAQLPADALPPGWSSGGSGARDPESAQRQAQQVGGVLVERAGPCVFALTGIPFFIENKLHFELVWYLAFSVSLSQILYDYLYQLFLQDSSCILPSCSLYCGVWFEHPTPPSTYCCSTSRHGRGIPCPPPTVLKFHNNSNSCVPYGAQQQWCGALVG